MAGIRSIFLKSPTVSDDHDFKFIPAREPPLPCNIRSTKTATPSIESERMVSKGVKGNDTDGYAPNGLSVGVGRRNIPLHRTPTKVAVSEDMKNNKSGDMLPHAHPANSRKLKIPLPRAPVRRSFTWGAGTRDSSEGIDSLPIASSGSSVKLTAAVLKLCSTDPPARAGSVSSRALSDLAASLWTDGDWDSDGGFESTSDSEDRHELPQSVTSKQKE